MCDIGYLVKPHIRAIMQLLTVRLPDYGMHMMTTKCLNTAVMMMYLFLGEAARAPTKHCDTRVIRERNQGQMSNPRDREIARQLCRDVLDPAAAGVHTLFYVMITDCDVPLESAPSRTVYFPGHVFVIERVPAMSPNEHGRFNLYQSYINQYSMAEHIDRHDALPVGKQAMKRHLDGLAALTESRLWTEKTTAFWKELTSVEATQFEGHVIEGNLMMCYQRVVPEGCVRKLQELVDREVAALADIIVVGKGGNKVFGGQRSTGAERDKGVEPLTNAQMFKQLRALQRKLR